MNKKIIEIIEKIIKLKEKDKGWTGHATISDRFGEYEKIQHAKDFGYEMAIDDVIELLCKSLTREKVKEV